MLFMGYLWGPVASVAALFLGASFSWSALSGGLLVPGGASSSSQLLFFVTLLLVSGSILLFTFYYFSSGGDYTRFMGILFCFLLSMVILIFHKGALSLFFGWDGLGVTSYLLVIYYTNFNSISGGTTTVMTNRLGDVFLFLFLLSGPFLFPLCSGGEVGALFLILCAFTKSAQAPFSSWLPMAMSAPTPVSSLVHSSTLVTAGLYLLMKYSYFWALTSFLSLIWGTGVVTMFIASTMALAEKDLKKIIALSTLSQLGFMMSGLGLGCLSMSFFHLVTHAFFKSCMFVQVGGMILINNTSQEGRAYAFSGNLSVSLILSVSCLSLCGFPFLSGFFSKDLLLLGVLSPSLGGVLSSVFLMGVFFTLIYSLRVMLFSLLSGSQSGSKAMLSLSYFFSSGALLGLGALSGGVLLKSFFFPPLPLLGSEKLVPLLFWGGLFFSPVGLIFFFEKLSGMGLQDSGALGFQKPLLPPTKLGESAQLSFLSFFNKGLSLGAGASLKSGALPPLLLGLFFLLILLFSLGVKHIFLPKSSL